MWQEFGVLRLRVSKTRHTYICAQRPPMGDSQLTRFTMSYVREILPRGTEPGPKWENVKKMGVPPPVYEERAVENVVFKPQYLKNGRSDFCEIFTICGS